MHTVWAKILSKVTWEQMQVWGPTVGEAGGELIRNPRHVLVVPDRSGAVQWWCHHHMKRRTSGAKLPQLILDDAENRIESGVDGAPLLGRHDHVRDAGEDTDVRLGPEVTSESSVTEME